MAGVLATPSPKEYPPLFFFYTHLHDAIRAELESLSSSILNLEGDFGEDRNLKAELSHLGDRYRFLGQVYKYHSSVEDEVVYPALDSKVKNVTLAYSVEHEDEEHLLEELSALFSAALSQSSDTTLRQIARKVEEIHTTLRKHLAKEEEQLLPLLLHHFSFREQAELVAQFLCSIPLAAVGPVLAWLKPIIPLDEQISLAAQVQNAVPDALLKQLMASWLAPHDTKNLHSGIDLPMTPAHSSEFICCQCRDVQPVLDVSTIGGETHDKDTPHTIMKHDASNRNNDKESHRICQHDLEDSYPQLLQQQQVIIGGGGDHACVLSATSPSLSTNPPLPKATTNKPSLSSSRPPLREVMYFHQAIRSALSSFAEEARLLRNTSLNSDITSTQLTALVERHRFIRAVCLFHSASEDEIVFPALRKLNTRAKKHASHHPMSSASELDQNRNQTIPLSNEVWSRSSPQENTHDETLLIDGDTNNDTNNNDNNNTNNNDNTTTTPTPPRHRCEDDHLQESAQFEVLGRLLGDVKSCIRRGTKEVSKLVENLSIVSERLARGMSRHMTREETDVLPVLMRSLCPAEQRHMVWKILQAMPLRLLERVMPWVSSKLREEDVREWLSNIRRAATANDQPLVLLLSQWADRRPTSNDDHFVGGHDTSGGGSIKAIDGVLARENDDGSGSIDIRTHDAVYTATKNRRHYTDDPSAYANITCKPILTASTALAHQGFVPGSTAADAILMPGTDMPPPKRIRTGHTTAATTTAATTMASLPHAASNPFHLHGDTNTTSGGNNSNNNHTTHAHILDDALLTPSIQPPPPSLHTATNTSKNRDLPPLPAQTPLPKRSLPTTTPIEGEKEEEEDSDSLENPIDHIFQFHKALRRELVELEAAAVDLQALVGATSLWSIPHAPVLLLNNTPNNTLTTTTDPSNAPSNPPSITTTGTGKAVARGTTSKPDRLVSAIQSLQGRFQFLRSIYQAHSAAEDEIVFPALEAKETLHNISHAYTLDHKQEESLFDELSLVVAGIKDCALEKDLPRLKTLSSKLARMCAAVRAALETHVRAEEKELWPLFVEHFTIDEQMHLVGVIIGRTGAEVLHAMLSWVKKSMTQEESDAMMVSMKSASRSTAFAQWLDVAQQRDGTATKKAARRRRGGGDDEDEDDPSSSSPPTTTTTTTTTTTMTWQEEQKEVLEEVAAYLAKNGIAGGIGIGTDAPPADPGSLAADPASFRPGWEDLFRMNQKQLEFAVRRVTADTSLEPQRKAYLIQHLMASRYIVAQQRKMSSESSTPASTKAATSGQPTTTIFGGGSGKLSLPSSSTATTTTTPTIPPTATAGSDTAAAVPGENDTLHHGDCSDQSTHRHYHDATLQILGCKHYRRGAMLVAPCCGRESVCRLCHDESVPDHQLDRHAVTEMICMYCGTKQRVGESCRNCQKSMAKYYCGICHLFDDDPERDIYHCPFCNFCRRGKGLGVDSFHCMACNACMSLELFNKHRCTEGALSGTCPVCSDPLFVSKSPIKELPCGHFMHSLCFGAYTKYSYACPVCSKSLGDMAVYWKMIDALLSSEVLPDEYALRRQSVRCHDCGIASEVPFHFVYHKCGGCGGYNTRLM